MSLWQNYKWAAHTTLPLWDRGILLGKELIQLFGMINSVSEKRIKGVVSIVLH